jgi:hypothetical protein
MQTDYMEEAKKRQEEEARAFRQTRDPFAYGQQVARRRYSEIMSGLENQARTVNQSYGDLYQRARQSGIQSEAAGGPRLSGGMGAQQRDYLSAAEMSSLGQIAGAQEGALRDIETARQSSFANAQLEGMQAEQIQLQSQQSKLQLVQQKQAILADTNLTEEQRNQQLQALGYDPSTVKKDVPAGVHPGFLAAGGFLGSIFLAKGLLGAKAGGSVLGASAGFLKAALPVLGWTGIVALAAIGVDKGLEWLAPNFNQGKGLFNLSDLGL